MTTTWSASQYLKFEDERTRPSRDLLARVPLAQPARIVDLGCGPGNSTELLAARFPDAQTIGIDSAPDMIDAARLRLPQLRFDLATVEDWTPEAPVDLVFANAVLQWVPDPLGAMVRLMDTLRPGGVLAVQMPDNRGEPSHLMMDEAAAAEPFRAAFAGTTPMRPPLDAPRDYFEALAPKSARLDIWHTIYNHPLAGAEAIVEWVKGTGLRPYLDVLPVNLREAYLAEYGRLIDAAYPPLADGRVLLRFPRLFVIAVKA